jgi:hypothetical protein
MRLIAVLCLLACQPPTLPCLKPGGCEEPLCEPDAGGPNPSFCPATWAAAQLKCRANLTCNPDLGLSCSYAGSGDEMDGCWGNAGLFCLPLDAGAGVWACAQ